MSNLYQYILDNFTLSGEASRMLDNICQYAADNFENDGRLTYEGVDFLDGILSDAIGIDKDEIAENWDYTV